MMETMVSVKPDATALPAGDAAADCLSVNEVRLLSSIGFMAAKAGCLVPAVRIFEALIVLRPGVAFPFIGMSMAYLAVGMAGEAVHVLRERAIPSCAEAAELRLWLGLALQQQGNHAAARKELDSSISGLPNEGIPTLAKTLAVLLGARPEVPTWPMPAPVSEPDSETASD